MCRWYTVNSNFIKPGPLDECQNLGVGGCLPIRWHLPTGGRCLSTDGVCAYFWSVCVLGDVPTSGWGPYFWVGGLCLLGGVCLVGGACLLGGSAPHTPMGWTTPSPRTDNEIDHTPWDGSHPLERSWDLPTPQDRPWDQRQEVTSYTPPGTEWLTHASALWSVIINHLSTQYNAAIK